MNTWKDPRRPCIELRWRGFFHEMVWTFYSLFDTIAYSDRLGDLNRTGAIRSEHGSSIARSDNEEHARLIEKPALGFLYGRKKNNE
ncbi:MAG: hypothetical protein ACRER2_11510 [Methylococcales bacterium]